MQRCPYLAEMKERFWRSNGNETKRIGGDEEGDELLKSVAMTKNKQSTTIARLAQPEPDDPDESLLPPPSTGGISTVVKVKPDGTGSRTVRAVECTPIWYQRPTAMKWCCNYAYKFPKNAKTSLFIITSALYCKLLVIITLAFLLSEVVTINVPLHFFEVVFTYLYGGSILFFLYVFCYLLHDSSQKKKQRKKDDKDKDSKKDEEMAADAAASKSGERKTSFLQEGRHKARYLISERERQDPLLPSESMLKGVRKGSDGKDMNLNDGSGEGGQSARPAGEKPESGASKECAPSKPKTSQTDFTAHGSFFLRMGTLAFGLGSMIYIGLELGSFFETPMGTPCFFILKGVNPLLQLIFTFMQMYFIFINSRLRIHKFKIIARFGLMHVIATNLCVWIRVLVRECLKEITRDPKYTGYSEDYMILEGRRLIDTRVDWMFNPTGKTGDHQESMGFNSGANYGYNQASGYMSSTGQQQQLNTSLPLNVTCHKLNFMGSIVIDAAPYLFPVVIEYSLIGAAVVFIIWRNIGRGIPTAKIADEGDEGHQEWEMGTDPHSRYSSGPAGVEAGPGAGPVDCVGASKGLFCGLLLLVAALICLILFFVLVAREQLRLLAIYLADCSHAALLIVSLLGTLIGFIRVRRLRFHGDLGSPLRDILLRVSVFGVFGYAMFSLISGTILGLTIDIPSILVAGTAALVLLQIIIQMLFISDVGRRRIHLAEHIRTKPGRQIVTLLLITNLTMWVIVTLEIRKVDSDPVQLNFYGRIPWLLIQRFALPLYIFHRFFSAVTLAEIWKNSYTLKYMPVSQSGP